MKLSCMMLGICGDLGGRVEEGHGLADGTFRGPGLSNHALLPAAAGVGKSCLLLRFAEDSFTSTFITTIG